MILPSHAVHAYIDRLYFGKAYWKVHKRMDAAWIVCRKGHRRYFHDWISAMAIAKATYPGDENAIWSAWLHIQTDELCSANPEFRKELEMVARTDVKKRKRRRRKEKNELPDPLKELVKFLEKVKQIKDMSRLLSR
jgi:hypothetical protein